MNAQKIAYGGLGYVGVAAPEPAGWVDFATSICGLMPARILPGGDTPMRMLTPAARGIAPDGTAYLLDWNNHMVRLLGLDGNLNTVVGNPFVPFTGDGPLPHRRREHCLLTASPLSGESARRTGSRGPPLP